MNAWPILFVLLATAVVMTLGWVWQRRHRNAGIVDVLWAGGMAASAIYYALVLPGAPLRRLLVGLWARACAGTWRAGYSTRKRMVVIATRGGDYAEYQRTTSSFVPLPPEALMSIPWSLHVHTDHFPGR